MGGSRASGIANADRRSVHVGLGLEQVRTDSELRVMVPLCTGQLECSDRNESAQQLPMLSESQLCWKTTTQAFSRKSHHYAV